MKSRPSAAQQHSSVTTKGHTFTVTNDQPANLPHESPWLLTEVAAHGTSGGRRTGEQVVLRLRLIRNAHEPHKLYAINLACPLNPRLPLGGLWFEESKDGTLTPLQ